MKKYFEYIGLIAFTLFSFYYTDKITSYMNKKDPVMIEILNYKENTKTNCNEGYITSDGVVLGFPGKIVNEKESYSNMQGDSFNKDLLVFDEITCKVNKENVKENYIISASPSLNKVSLFIEIVDMKYIKDIISVFKEKNILVNIIVDGETLENNKDYFNELKNNYEIIYKGKNNEDYNKFNKIINSEYCISLNNMNMDMCKNKIKLKSNYYYNKDILLNTKKNLEKGSFYIYKENMNTLDEIGSVINFIKGKNIEIVNISDILN